MRSQNIVGSMANSADPDQTAPKEQSDQSLHCFLGITVPVFRSIMVMHSVRIILM